MKQIVITHSFQKNLKKLILHVPDMPQGEVEVIILKNRLTNSPFNSIPLPPSNGSPPISQE
jgi:hypothetical protein